MPENPYQSPLAPGLDVSDEPQPERGRRPIGIWILSGLHVLLGLLFVSAVCFLVWQAIVDVDFRPGPPLSLMVVLIGIFGALSLGSGIGMWLGAKWGWWLGSFVYVWAAVGSAVQIPLYVWNFGAQAITDNPRLLQERAITLVISSLIALYFFKSSVRDFFGLRSLRMGFALLLLAVISILAMAAMGGVVLVIAAAAFEE